MKVTAEEYLNLDVVNIHKTHPQKLTYDLDLETQLVEIARTGYPNEIVGFLLGSADGQELVTELFEVKNVAENQNRRFKIDPLDYIKAETYALARNLDVIGIYHSHPDYPAIPSKHDLEFAQSVFAYAIVSVDGNGDTLINSWKKSNKKFIQQSIIIRS